MSVLREQYGLLARFLRTDFPRLVLVCALVLLAGAALGGALAAQSPESVEAAAGLLVEQAQSAGVVDGNGETSVFGLLAHNWTAMLLSAACGLVPFVFLSALTAAVNGAVVGMLAVWYAMNGLSLRLFCAGLLPHGVFELPALLLSTACGVALCRNLCRLAAGSERRTPMAELLSDLLRVLLLLVLPLTVCAAVTEAKITPAVMAWAG